MNAGVPVSWYLIEPGWEVVDRDGGPVGKIHEVAGDSTHDIFDGLSVSTGIIGKPRYVPSEQVAEITQGRVQLTLSSEEAERLGEYEQPAETMRIQAGTGSLRDRIAGWFRR